MTTRLGTTRSLLATLLATICAATALATIAAPARAGNYHVYQCHSAYGYANSGWIWGANGFPGGLHGCTTEFGMVATGYGSGEFLWWRSPVLPANLTISSLTYTANSAEGTFNPSILNAFMCTGSAVASGPYPCDLYTDVVHMPTAVTANATYTLGCSAPASTSTCKMAGFGLRSSVGYGPTNGWFGIRNVVATINDHVAPGAWPPHNGTLRNNNSVNSMWADGNFWNSGSKTVGIYGHDGSAGSGIKSTKVFFDGVSDAGSPDHNFASPCDYRNWQPCPNFTSNVPNINTTAFADGAHTATTRVTDAGDNVTDATAVFMVDNTEPDTPSAVDISGTSQGWSSSNDFDVSWTNATEQTETATQSGIAQVRVNVEPTDPGSQVDPAAVNIPVGSTVSGISATVNSISGLTLPAVGEWTLRLSVIDRADNESPVGDGSGASADSDFTVGYDPTPPAAPGGQANGWISRDELANGYQQKWDYVASPTQVAPLCGFATSITNSAADPGTAINLVGDVRKMTLPANLTEGTHSVNLRSVTCAGVPSPTYEQVDAPVDRTDPTGQVTGVEDDQWYKDNQVVNLIGADALSGMAPSATIEVKEGAYLAYSINGATEALIPGANSSFPVNGEGLKELSFSPVDLAGNRATTKIVRFGIDATAPNGAFAAQDTERPTLLRAPVSDPTSGLNLAGIEVRNQAGGEWIMLPTSIADSSGQAVAGYPKSADISARFPDTQLPRGTYSVRLKSYDRAGNELVTSKRADGSEMTVTNPMRKGVALSAGLSKAVRTCSKKRTSKAKKRGKKVQRNGKCFKRHRGKVVFTGTTQTLAVGFKRGAVVQGFLTDESYSGLSRQPIEIYAKTKTGDEKLIGTTSTGADGSYVFKITPGMSRVVRVYFPGTETREDISASVNLGTGAKITLKASTRNARTGTTVTFRGKVRSYDGSIPAAGKIVALQFYAGKKWRPAVGIVHTDSQGNYSVKYKFEGKGIRSRIVFRAFAPSEDNWSHTASGSKRITMKVNY